MPTTGDSFDERMAHLSREVGTGTLTARCEVDQDYAQDQHETPYRHRVGAYNYLRGPFLAAGLELIESLAPHAVTPEGSSLVDGMSDIAEKMSGYVLENAPKDTGKLSTSGHPTVIDNGVIVYDRPPISPREAV